MSAVQGTAEWLATRRASVSSTDVGVLLGLNPWKSEWELAAEKAGTLEAAGSTLPMRVGLALEPLIRQEYERLTGQRLQRVRRLAIHPTIPWAVASPDYKVIGTGHLVEAKWSLSRRWADGLPQDVESQVQWCLGVTGRKHCDVAALIGGSELRIYPVEFDDEVFEGLLDIAAEFRARMVAGGPFSHSLESLKRAYPTDSGAEMYADTETAEAVGTLIDVRGRRKALEADEERLEVLVKERMGEATTLVGPGWRVTWKQTKEVSTVDWKSVADGLLRTLPETERTALVGIHTTVRPGFRPFRVVSKEDTE